jgi:hypothetical protein
MATLLFHAPVSTDRKIRAAAKKQGVKGSRYLLNVAEQAAKGGPVTGLGRGDFTPATRHGLRILSPSVAKRDFL